MVLLASEYMRDSTTEKDVLYMLPLFDGSTNKP